MGRLIEQDSVKAARILDSARELALEHGVRKVTIAEIAAAANVGKGTVYLYWETKEDLFLGLLAREVLAWIDTLAAQIAEDPHWILPRRLASLLLRTTQDNVWLRRIRSGDSLQEVLHRPADRERFAQASLGAMGNAVVAILRDHGIIRDDLPLARQMYATRALLVGFGTVRTDPVINDLFDVTDAESALADTFHLLLEPSEDPADAIVSTAAVAVRARFAEIHDSLRELVTAGAAGTR